MLVQIANISIAQVRAPVVGHVADACLMWIEPGQQACPARAASADVVELRESQPAGREGIQVRRVDLAAIAADVAETDIIGEQDDDVRSIRCIGGHA